MKFQTQLFLFFIVLVSVSVAIIAFFSVDYVTSEAIKTQIQEMHSDDAEIESKISHMHNDASEFLLFTIENPIFVEYFDLPETKAGNVYDNGVLQFSENQRNLKNKLDSWIYNFQNKFQVDETCLIDNTGQEHTRLVLTQIQPDSTLSSQEKQTPFFEPSFQQQEGQVYIQYPYVSPDTHRWVFAYTSPIVLPNGQKPAIFHFEMPLEIFQSLVEKAESDGVTYVVDPHGFIIAYSKENITHNEINTTFPNEYFPSMEQIFGENSDVIMKTITSNDFGDGKYVFNGQDIYFVYKKLPTFNWILVYEKPASDFLVVNHTISDLVQMIVIVTIGLIGASIFASLLISKRLSNPITILAKTIDAQNPERLEALSIPNNEIGLISKSLNSLLQKIDDFQNEINLKNHELEIQKHQLEKLAKIGEITSSLIHNLRNPLTVIKSSLDLIKFQSELDPKIHERINQIQDAAENIKKQIDSVLVFVKERPLAIQQTSLKQIIDRSISLVSIPDSISIQLPVHDYEMCADPDKLELVFMNLFSNAIDAMNDHGHITVNAHVQNTSLVIDVIDSGPGFSNDVKEKIFDTLFTTKSSGTGLGLPYCKSIVEQHGGSIVVDVNPTKFTISLPMRTENLVDKK